MRSRPSFTWPTLCYLREHNISTKIFESGLGISLFRDNSTRTRFSFASACNLLGLEVQDPGRGQESQIAHGETVRETANMISFMADVIGIRDDMYIGKGNKYMHDVVDAVTQGHKDGVLEQKPTLVNLQCDIDHPTQCMADMLHIIHEFGGVENLKGKKVAMTWAYSPSYGKPLSVPQGVIGLMTRFGMDVVLAHPEGYEVMPEVEAVAAANAEKAGGTFRRVNSMAEAFQDADIVYPKSWAPFAAMEKRTDLYAQGDSEGIKALEKELLAQNAQHKDWCCTEERMKTTRDGKALYQTACPPTSTAYPAWTARWRRASSTATARRCTKRLLQALHHRRHDLPGQMQRSPGRAEGPGGARHPALVQQVTRPALLLDTCSPFSGPSASILWAGRPFQSIDPAEVNAAASAS